MLHRLLRLALVLPVAALIMSASQCDDDDDDSSPAILNSVTNPQTRVLLGFVGRYNSGQFNVGSAEIAAFDPATDRLFSINAGAGTVDVLTLANPAAPVLLDTIDCAPFAGGAGSPNSVAVKNGLLAIAVQSGVKTDPGQVVFFTAGDATFDTALNAIDVGALPDMVVFTPDGNRLLVANEGEPNNDYTIDPEGTISIIDVTGGAAAATVQTAGFGLYNAQKAALKAAGVRIFGVDVTAAEADGVAQVARDLEPEYIALSADGATAWVTLQENNAIAILNVLTATVTQIVPLGYKDHAVVRNSLDPSDRDGAASTQIFQMVNGPVRGLYLPDAIASFQSGGQTFLVTANEGDAREWTGAPGLIEEARLGAAGVTLDPAIFPNAAALKANASFGRLNITTRTGNTDGDAELEAIYTLGGRSFSIWNQSGVLVYDSGDDFERITAAAVPNHFNASNTNNALDDRSDNKGPEPEGVCIGAIGDRTYAFVILERVGGVMVYDVTTPTLPVFQTYVNTRDFSNVPGPGAGVGLPVSGLDLGPEGILFISAADSPSGKALVVISHEISGSTLILQVTQLFQ